MRNTDHESREMIVGIHTNTHRDRQQREEIEKYTMVPALRWSLLVILKSSSCSHLETLIIASMWQFGHALN